MASSTPRPQPPPFVAHTPETINSTTDRLIAEFSRVWDQVASIPPDQATFFNAIQPLIAEENQRLTESRLIYFLSTASPSQPLREATKAANIRLTQHEIQQLTRDDVYSVVSVLASAEKEEGSLPSAESQLYLRRLLRDFRANGLGLPSAAQDRARLKEINVRLVEVGKEYLANLNADVSGMWLSPEELDGLSDADLERLGPLHTEGEGKGKYWVNFKRPTLAAVLSYAKRGDVRRRYHAGWDNRMAESNGPLVREMLLLRREGARILGFENFAVSRDEYRMLSAEAVEEFLESLGGRLGVVGRLEVEALEALKREELKDLPLEYKKDESSALERIFRWDSRYYGRMVKGQAGSEQVREYFSFTLLLPKLFDMYSLLFGLRFEILSPEQEKIETWHEDVMVIAAWNDQDEGGGFVGYLYIDPYPRPGKYGHVGQYGIQPVSFALRCGLFDSNTVHMHELTYSASHQGFTKADGTRHYPVSCLMLNYTPPTPTRPSLLRYPEVVNLFHELGHSMHWLCSHSTHARFHQNTPRDFVEIPSRLLEHFFYDANVIRAVSSHWEYPEKRLPEDAIAQLIATRYQGDALSACATLQLARFDQRVHTSWDGTEDLSVVHNRTLREIGLYAGPQDLGEGESTLHGHTHLRFLNGYAASYYAYLL